MDKPECIVWSDEPGNTFPTEKPVKTMAFYICQWPQGGNNDK